MRKTKTKLLNFSLLLLLIYSCSNEHNFLSGHHHHGKKSNDISLKQFLKETNIKTFDTNLKIGKQDNALFRTAQITDFIVDTTSILKHIAENNKTTYSFKTNSVSNEFSNAKTYNLVYFKVNNTWENTVISFDQTDSDVNPNLKQITNIEQIYSSNLPTNNQIQRVCYQYTYSISCDGSCDGPCDGFACPTGQCIKMTISTTSCGGGPDSDNFNDIILNPLDSGGGGSSSILEFEPNPKGGGGSLVDNPNPTPCEDLKIKSIEDLVFKNKIDSLKNLVSANNPNRDTHETSVVMKRLDDVYYYNVNNNNIENSQTVSVKYTASIYDVAVLHNHPINTLPIYSPRDIVDLFDNYNFVTQSRKEEYTSYLVNFNNTTYAIKMENVGVLNDLIGEFNLSTEDGILKADRAILEIYEKYGFKKTQAYTQEMAEELFLNVMNDTAFGSGSSIGIYRQTNGTWGKLSKSGGSVISTPCPN